jgi:hypothetical protein
MADFERRLAVKPSAMASVNTEEAARALVPDLSCPGVELFESASYPGPARMMSEVGRSRGAEGGWLSPSVVDKSVAVREELSLNDELLFDAFLFGSLSSGRQYVDDEEAGSLSSGRQYVDDEEAESVSFTLDG